MDKTQQSKAKRSAGRSGGCECGHGDEGDETSCGSDFEQWGRARFLEEVQAAAREALAALPAGDALRRMNKPAREMIAHMTELYAKASLATEWQDGDIENLAREMGWVKVVMDLELAARMKNDDGPGGYDTDCNKVYDTCMEQSGCTHSFFCLCCVPCSIKYSRCVLGLPLTRGGGIFIG